MNSQTRAELKALTDVVEASAAGTPEGSPGALFMSGLLAGLALAASIDDGSTAEQQLEDLKARLETAVGRAYLAGKMPPCAAPNGIATQHCTLPVGHGGPRHADGDSSWPRKETRA